MAERVVIEKSRQGHSLCWHCKEDPGPEPLCPHCVKLQPLGRDSDYFSVMGLPRKLGIDARVLEPVYHALSRRFHPDVYRMASPRERMIALENSAVLNQAYRALKDPFERASYLLQLERGRNRETKPAAPHDLFEEILEVQELLGEYQFTDPDEKAALRPKVEAKRDELQAEQDHRARRLMEEVFPRWDALMEARPTPEQKAPVLAEIERLLGERSYLRRVLNTLNDTLS